MLEHQIHSPPALLTISSCPQPISFFTLFLLSSFQAYCHRNPGGDSFHQCIVFYHSLLRSMLEQLQNAKEQPHSSYGMVFQTHYRELVILLPCPSFPAVQPLLSSINTILLGILPSSPLFLKTVIPLWSSFLSTMLLLCKRSHHHPFSLTGAIMETNEGMEEIIQSWSNDCCRYCYKQLERGFDSLSMMTYACNACAIQTDKPTSTTPLPIRTLQHILLNSLSVLAYHSDPQKAQQALEVRDFVLSEWIYNQQETEYSLEQSSPAIHSQYPSTKRPIKATSKSNRNRNRNKNREEQEKEKEKEKIVSSPSPHKPQRTMSHNQSTQSRSKSIQKTNTSSLYSWKPLLSLPPLPQLLQQSVCPSHSLRWCYESSLCTSSLLPSVTPILTFILTTASTTSSSRVRASILHSLQPVIQVSPTLLIQPVFLRMLTMTLSSNQAIVVDHSIALIARVPSMILQNSLLAQSTIAVGLKQSSRSVRTQTMQLITQCVEFILIKHSYALTADEEKFLKYSIQQTLKHLVIEREENVIQAGQNVLRMIWTISNPCHSYLPHLSCLRHLVHVVNDCSDALVPNDRALRPALLTALNHPSLLKDLRCHLMDTIRRLAEQPFLEDLHLLHFLLDIVTINDKNGEDDKDDKDDKDNIAGNVFSILHSLLRQHHNPIIVYSLRVLLQMLSTQWNPIWTDHFHSFLSELEEILQRDLSIEGMKLTVQCMMMLINHSFINDDHYYTWSQATLINLVEVNTNHLRTWEQSINSLLSAEEIQHVNRSIIVLHQVYEYVHPSILGTMIVTSSQNNNNNNNNNNNIIWGYEEIIDVFKRFFLNQFAQNPHLNSIRIHALESLIACCLKYGTSVSKDVIDAIKIVSLSF